MDNLPPSAQRLLELAKLEPKGDYRIYGHYKRKLEYFSLSHVQYEAAHMELAQIMRL